MGAPTVAAATVAPVEKNGVDKVCLEKKAVKPEAANSNFGDKRVADHPVREKKTVIGDGAPVPNAKESADVKVSASTAAGLVTTKTEVDKRCRQLLN